jgi:hypothetical protein
VSGPGARRPARPARLIAGLLLLALAAPVAWGQCDLSQEPVRLTVNGLGTAYFQDFETTPDGTAVELSGGVCIVGEGTRWTLVAETATLSGLQSGDEPRAEVERPVLTYQGWRIVAEVLRSDATELALEEATFSGRGVMGSARTLLVDLRGGGTSAQEVRVLGESFRLEAEAAELLNDAVDMRLVTITTCTCPGTPFYLVSGSEARLELGSQRLEVEGGELRLAGLRLPLAERFQLSAAIFEELALPVTLEYRPGSSGTGLGLVVPDLELEEGLSLEMGLLGLDGGKPLQAFALANYRRGNVSFSAGRARGGPRADFSYVEPLAPGLEASFAIRNRHEVQSDFLHEGVLELLAAPAPLKLPGDSSLSLKGSLFAAGSAQELPGGTVVSPRLGTLAGAQVAVPTGPGATLTVGVEGRLTDYPAVAASQYGVSLRTGWRYRRGPWTLDLRHQRMWTDSGSPFSTKLDRLVPANELVAQAALAGPLGGGFNGRARLDFDYDLLLLGGDEPEGIERLGATVAVGYPVGGWSFGLEGNLELAGLLDPDPAGERKAHVQTTFTAEREEWELGAKVRWGLRPGSEGLSLLETRLAVPLGYDQGTLTPYLALDFAPLLTGGDSLRLSGHGVALTWRSCCGTLKLGYRQQDSTFSTTIGLALEH